MAPEHVLERDIELNTLLHLISLFEPFRELKRGVLFFFWLYKTLLCDLPPDLHIFIEHVRQRKRCAMGCENKDN